jgi:hypothetical protein
LQTKTFARPNSLALAAPFLLVARQYQHALFGVWPQLRRAGFRKDLKEVGLEQNPTLMGLHYFLSSSQTSSVPRTLRDELSALSDALDPALADPDLEIDVSSRSTILLRDIDARFSHSVREGIDAIRKYQCLTSLEIDLLRRLADADDLLGSPTIRKQKPTTAARLQILVRSFACRLVRRTLGTRNAVVRGSGLLRDYEQVVAGDKDLFYQAAKQVESLLNYDNKFTVTLNSTFGEPPPPETRRVVLETQKQKVRPGKPEGPGRPNSDLRFLTVGSNTSTQALPLTYELFRSVRELQAGMLVASLPRSVVASLDTARARLAGRIVRDEEQLDGAEIRLGIRPERIARENGEFILRRDIPA